jgi:WD40 repeat protein
VWSVAFDPSGKRILSVSIDNYIQIWDPATGQHVAFRKRIGRMQSVQRVDFSAADNRIIVEYEDDMVCEYDIEDVDDDTLSLRPGDVSPLPALCEVAAEDDSAEVLEPQLDAVNEDGETVIKCGSTIVARHPNDTEIAANHPTDPIWVYGRSDGHVGIMRIEDYTPNE